MDELAKLHQQIKEVRLQETLGKQSCQFDSKELIEPTKEIVESKIEKVLEENKSTTELIDELNKKKFL